MPGDKGSVRSIQTGEEGKVIDHCSAQKGKAPAAGQRRDTERGTLMLTPQQIESFWSKGYLKLNQLLTPQEVEVLKQGLDEVLQGQVEWPKSCFQILDPTKYRSPTGDVM